MADLSLRLAAELRPDSEPDMGRRLPERWHVAPGLLPEARVDIDAPSAVPKSIQGLARVDHDHAVKVLTRSPGAYSEAVADQVRVLTERPAMLAALFEHAEAASDGTDGPRIDPIGAAELDQALGGEVFGDPVALRSEQGEDAADRIGNCSLKQPSTRRAASPRRCWRRGCALMRTRVQPMGPTKVATMLRDPDQPWALLREHISGANGVSSPTRVSRLGVAFPGSAASTDEVR